MASVSSSQAVPAPTKRSEKFYYNDIVFLVEGELFKVYDYFFTEHSPQIKEMMKKARDVIVDDASFGLDDHLQTLPLSGVTKFEFERFLSIIYPLHPLNKPFDRFYTDWQNIPKLASKLGMHAFRDYCIEILKPQLTMMSSVDRIVLGRQFSVSEWFQDAIYELVTRQILLKPDQGKLLRFETAFCITRLQARWMLLEEENRRRSSWEGERGLEDLKRALRETIQSCFRSELNEMGLKYAFKSFDTFYGCVDDDDSFLLQQIQIQTSSPEAETLSSSGAPGKNRLHYYHSIIFLVENELFKVHDAYLLQHSPVFRDMMKFQAQSHRTCVDGTKDKEPLRLSGVNKNSFELFLTVIFPKNFLADHQLTFDEWESVLELSTMWRMRTLRKYCIGRMSPLKHSVLPPVQRVLMARRYMAENWLTEAYEDIITQSDLILDKEIEDLGSETSFKILRLTEKWLKCRPSRPDLQNDIRSAFEKELNRLENYDIDSEAERN